MAFVKVLLGLAVLLATGEKRTVPESEIRDVVEKFIASHFEDTTVDYHIEYRALPSKLVNIPQQATLQVAADPEAPIRGNVAIPIEVFANRRVAHTFVISVKVRTFGQVLIATDKIEKHDLAADVAATEERIETTTLAGNVVSHRVDLSGKRAKQIIRKGAVLTESMFERVPVVNQGSKVTLIMKANNVVVKANAIVREDGGSGDVVLVQKEGSGDKLKARVVDGNTVELLATND
jgi:flagella basal body P-ring formation protein FlgA